MKSIKTRLLLTLLPITLVLLAALAYVNYFKTTEIFTRSVQEHLQSIVSAKQAALVDHIESTEKIGSAIAATDIVQTYIELTNRNLTGNNKETVEGLGRRVENILYSFQEAHWGRYHHIFMVNRSNRIVISPNHGAMEKGSPSLLLDKDMMRNKWALEALQKGITTLSDYSSWRSSDHDHQVLFFPVRDASNRVQAVIGFELHVPYQQQILMQGFSFGRSGRISLINLEGESIVSNASETQPRLTNDILVQAKLSNTVTGRRLNTQGREVIGYYSRIGQYPWILTAEIETDEVFYSLYRLQIILAAGLVATLLVVAVLLWVFAGAIARPVHDLISHVEKVSRGEFNIEIPDSRRKDEVGRLTLALQQLVFSLQLVSKKLRQAKAFRKAS